MEGRRCTLDRALGYAGPVVLALPKPVDRDDSGMLQAACYLGFEQKTCPATGIVSEACLNLLESHLSIEFTVFGHKYLAQAASIVQMQDGKPAVRS